MIDRSVVHGSGDDSDDYSDEDQLPTARQRVVV